MSYYLTDRPGTCRMAGGSRRYFARHFSGVPPAVNPGPVIGQGRRQGAHPASLSTAEKGSWRASQNTKPDLDGHQGPSHPRPHHTIACSPPRGQRRHGGDECELRKPGRHNGPGLVVDGYILLTIPISHRPPLLNIALLLLSPSDRPLFCLCRSSSRLSYTSRWNPRVTQGT